MKLSPLQLERLVFERVVLETADAEQSEVERGGRITVQLPELSQGAEDASKWRVVAVISLEKDEAGGMPPYIGELKLTGYFQYPSEELGDAEAAYVVGVNAASVLYSTARDYFWNLTSRGRSGGFLLPTADFRDLAVESDEDEDAVQMSLEESASAEK